MKKCDICKRIICKYGLDLPHENILKKGLICDECINQVLDNLKR
jgi:hypothetical protein